MYRFAALPPRQAMQALNAFRYNPGIRDGSRTQREDRQAYMTQCIDFAERNATKEWVFLDQGVLHRLLPYDRSAARVRPRTYKDLEAETIFASYLSPSIVEVFEDLYDDGIPMMYVLDEGAHYMLAKSGGRIGAAALRAAARSFDRLRNPSAAVIAQISRARQLQEQKRERERKRPRRDAGASVGGSGSGYGSGSRSVRRQRRQ